jgi:diketogulonate reductase-like aldo/keto reductase
MATSDRLRYTRIPLTHGSGAIPAGGFDSLIPDPLAITQVTKTALELGFRHLDCADRYRNEYAVGDTMQATFKAGTDRRENVFVTEKVRNINHRPTIIALNGSNPPLTQISGDCDYVDCHLIHTLFAFRPGDEQERRDAHGQVIYYSGVTLVETWRALERLVDEGYCKSIGVSTARQR